MNKHKIKLLFIMFVLLGLLIGCQTSVENNSQINENSFDMKAANNVAEAYMNYLIKGDMNNIQKLYSKELLNTRVKNENKSLNIFGYDLNNSSQVGKSGVFIMDVSRSSRNKPFASLDQYSIKIIKEGSDYKIAETNNTSQKEAFIYKNKIRLKNKNDANLNLVMAMRGMPSYVFSKDDKANINKTQVPRREFGIMNFSYDGNLLAVTTIDKNCYIGVISIDNSLTVQGQQDSGGGQGSSGGGAGDEAGEDDNIMEKPIGKEIVSMDILKDAKVNFMSFSKDQKFLAVQYSKGNIENCIRLYRVDGGDIAKYKFEENFPLDKVNIIFSSFDEDILNFDVVSKTKQDDSMNDIVGKWQLDLKQFKAVKM